MVANNLNPNQLHSRLGSVGPLVSGGKVKWLNPNLAGNPVAIQRAAQLGVRQANVPIILAGKKNIADQITKDLERAVQSELRVLQSKAAKTLTANVLAKQVEQSVIQGLHRNIDQASLAAAGVIMPRLNKLRTTKTRNPYQDWSDFSDNPPPTNFGNRLGRPDEIASEMLSGLSEGGGEDSALANQIARNYGGGGGYAPDQSTQPGASDFSAVEPGKENLPAYDLSPKQKAAFAEQQLRQQLAQSGGAGRATAARRSPAGTAPEAKEAATQNQARTGRNARPQINQPVQGMDELVQLQQQAADERKNFSMDGKESARERLQHTSLANVKHKYHRYQGLLAADKKYLKGQQDRSGGTGPIKQGLLRKAAYFAGLSALENQATSVGHKIQSNIEHGKFSGFVVALAMALIVDGLSIGALFVDGNTITGIIMWVVNAFFIIALGAILLGHGHYFVRWVLKRFFGKEVLKVVVSVFSLFIEFTPVAGALPMWTIQILWLKYDVDKAIAEHKRDLREVENQIKKEIRRAKKSGQINYRKIARLRQRLEKIQKKAYA